MHAANRTEYLTSSMLSRTNNLVIKSYKFLQISKTILYYFFVKNDRLFYIHVSHYAYGILNYLAIPQILNLLKTVFYTPRFIANNYLNYNTWN